MAGILDPQVIEKFKEFQKKTGRYFDLDINKIQFDDISLANDTYFEFIKGKNKYIQKYITKNPGEYPILGSSLKNECIANYIKPIDSSDIINKPCVSFNKDNAKGSIPFYRNYPFLMDRHHIAILCSDDIFPQYLYYSLITYFEKSKFGWGENVADVPTVSTHSIPIPKDYNENYKSIDIQKAIVEFLEYSFDNLERIKNNIDKRYEIVTKMKKSLIPSTFKKTAIQNRFRQYAQENSINFDITDIEFKPIAFQDFFEIIAISKKIQSKQFKESGAFPVISQSEDFINGYYDNSDGVINASTHPHIVFGDHTTILKYIDFDFLVGADGTKVLKPKPNIYPKYSYFQSFNKVKNQGYQRHFQYLKEKEFVIPKLDDYQSYELQKILADFIECVDNELEEKYFKKYNRANEVVRLLIETYLKRTFNKIIWS